MVLLVTRTTPAYRLRLAGTQSEVEAAQRLRFEVFNLELHEGLEASLATGLDADPFDAVCDHLLVEEVETGAVIGTYRLQTGTTAAAKLGYYSEQEFQFAPFEPMRGQMIELGRACVHQKHRNLLVLGQLWKGIGAYAAERGARYLCGCSSLTSQDPREGASAYRILASAHLAPSPWRTEPQPEFHCAMDLEAEAPPKIPKLLAAYLSLGAKICGPPALDSFFKTIDFLTLMDLESISPANRSRYHI